MAALLFSCIYILCDGSAQGSGNLTTLTAKSYLDSAVQADLKPSDQPVAEILDRGALRK